MKATPMSIPEVLLLEPNVFADDRGFFFESFNHRVFEEIVGRKISFVQDNHSHSVKNVVRGLHYQLQHPQGKLVRVIVGDIFDVAVDLRLTSPTFGQWVGVRLSAENKKQLFIPEGFAHGFAVISETADILYKTTDYWVKNDEHTLIWDDQSLAIDWPVIGEVLLSEKDRGGIRIEEAEVFLLGIKR